VTQLAPDAHLTYLIAKVEHQLTLALDRALEPTGMTLRQFSALTHIARQPGLRKAELAHLLLTSPQAVGTLIERLTSMGLVVRESRGRGVASALRLSDEGLSRLRLADQIASRAERDGLSALAPEEQAETFARLNRVLESLLANHT